MTTIKQFRDQFSVSPRYSGESNAWQTSHQDCEVICYAVAGVKGYYARAWGVIYKGPRVLFAYINGNRIMDVGRAYQFIKQCAVDKYIPDNCEKVLAIEAI